MWPLFSTKEYITFNLKLLKRADLMQCFIGAHLFRANPCSIPFRSLETHQSKSYRILFSRSVMQILQEENGIPIIFPLRTSRYVYIEALGCTIAWNCTEISALRSLDSYYMPRPYFVPFFLAGWMAKKFGWCCGTLRVKRNLTPSLRYLKTLSIEFCCYVFRF